MATKVQLTLSDEELAAVELLAKKRGLSRADVIRQAIMTEVELDQALKGRDTATVDIERS